ncbi:MAG: MBL fold metallo-hydrolase [Macellibacteroides sp.]|uniref:MBL fold metallo-hydrolase n=1 Tax=Macellibacteroides sp. TaxID=2014584 RepID=UPI003E703A3D
MNLTRVFHPIGQGAFYTERHNFNGENFTIVYDCGSLTLKNEKLKNVIISCFQKDEAIDILFISHFHADHISGIEYLKEHCNIKLVVIPYFDDISKNIAKICNYINGYKNTVLIDNPTLFFGEGTRVITIEERNMKSIYNNEPIVINNNDNELQSTYPSGSNFTYESSSNMQNRKWFFVPYNYKITVNRDRFIQNLNKLSIEVSSINSIKDIIRNIKNITKAYKAISGDLNDTSMLLFSGRMIDDYLSYYDSSLDTTTCSSMFQANKEIQSGCLYTGDISLNKKDLISELKSDYSLFWPHIGTLQIPHHGSIENFNEDILVRNMRIAVFSYGLNNQFGHPSFRVLNQVLSHRLRCVCVTEKRESIYFQGLFEN